MFQWFKKPYQVLIVCHANITRSPFFAKYLEKILADYPMHFKRKINIDSAGIQAMEGASANMIMSSIADMHEVNLRNHRSKPVDSGIVKKSDLILTMEASQRDSILEEFKEADGKVFTVLEFGRNQEMIDDIDVPDPTGKDAEEYQEFLNLTVREAPRVRDALEEWIEKQIAN